MPDAQRAEIAKLEALHAEHPQGRIFTHLAEAYRKAGELERARDVLAEGIERHPDYSSAHVVLARVLADMGEGEAAIEEFQRVLELDSHNLVALRSLGDLSRAAGRPQDAIGYYHRLLDVEPSDDAVREAIEALENPAAEAPAADEFSLPDDAEGLDAFAEPAHAQPEEEPVGLSDDDAPWTLEPTDDLGAAPDADEDAPWMAGDAEEGEDPFPLLNWDAGAEDDEVALPPPDTGEPGVMTETIAQVYARQGLYDRAAEVYRELVRDRPGDETLRTRLHEMEALAEQHDVEDHSERLPGLVTNELDDVPDVAPLAGLESTEIDPETGLRPVGEGEPMEGLPEETVSDVPAPPEEETPWTLPEVAGGEEPWSATEDPAEEDPWAASSAETEEPSTVDPWSAFDAEAEESPTEADPWSTPEPREAEEPEEAEPWSAAGTSAEEPWSTAAPDEDEAPWSGAADAVAEESEAEEHAESVWTGAHGAAGGEESPYAWSPDEEGEGAEDDSEPIRAYFQGLLGWAVEGGGAAAESDAPAPAGPEPEVAESGAAADDEAADDDDLDTFRSWLESLKQ